MCVCICLNVCASVCVSAVGTHASSVGKTNNEAALARKRAFYFSWAPSWIGGHVKTKKAGPLRALWYLDMLGALRNLRKLSL